MNLEEFRKLGGRSRWKGVSKKKRSEHMKWVRSKRYPQVTSKHVDNNIRSTII